MSVRKRYRRRRKGETVSLQVRLVTMMERRAVEQWSDREVEVGVLIREEQTPLSPCPPDTHTHGRTEDHCLPAQTQTHTHTRARRQRANMPARPQTPSNSHYLGNCTRLQVTDSRHLHMDRDARLSASCHGDEYY